MVHPIEGAQEGFRGGEFTCSFATSRVVAAPSNWLEVIASPVFEPEGHGDEDGALV
ncbi:MAG: hypothetical protein JJT96_08425 [Opitutales bacterium]|nr:hypothetical protein [Opitutales bacterium]